MSIKTFAAIDVGSYELSMKIFEISSKGGLKEIDFIRHRIELGTDTYTTGKISNSRVDELCAVLIEFTRIMKSYKVDDYKAYGTSAIRETENSIIILDKIAQRTGVAIEVLSNSEQRFLDYKSIASKGEKFNQIIEKGTAIVDVGGGSIQISLFDKDSLMLTQNIRLGILRIREKLVDLQSQTRHYERLIEELIDNELHIFKKMYLKDKEIENIIVVDDYISYIMQRAGKDRHQDTITSEEFMHFLDLLRVNTPEQVAMKLDIPSENSSLLIPSAILIKRLVEITGAKMLWAPGVRLSDGMAYDYAETNNIIQVQHNFDDDIITCAKNISKRFMGSKNRGTLLERLALAIFDSMKKIHGLGKRERLLLRIATILHDCGKYISLESVAENSYNIIMSTEMIGLSHMEREIIANVIKYNTLEFGYYSEMAADSNLDKPSYLIITKLVAILRVANGLNRSYKQKIKDVRAVLKEDMLLLTLDTNADMTLEKGLFAKKANFFEEVFSITPVIKQKKSL